MATRLLPSHTLARLPGATAAPSMALSAPHTRLALPAFSSLPSSSSSSLLSSSFLSFFTAAASQAAAGRRRSETLAVVHAAEGDEAAETVENEAADVEEAEAGLTEEEGEGEEDEQPPRKPIVKLGDIMGILHKRAIEASEKERPVPDIRTGDIVEIKLEVPENRRRASIYKGIVISKQNAGIHTTIRIRRIVAGIGVEIVFPLNHTG